MNFIDLIWLFFIASALSPIIQKKMLESARLRLIRKIEKDRKSRVIAMIHRQETMALLGFPIFKYIDIQDSEEVMRAIRMTDEAVPIDLVLHTPGGLVLAAEQIAYALKGHKAKVTVFVPHYAMSGGTLIALAADEIVMDPHAVLGPVDPQLGQYPAASILKVLEKKDINKIDDQTLIMADISLKALNQVKNCVKTILSPKLSEEKAEQIADLLSRGQWTHDYPITYKQAKELGLPVSTKMPVEIYQLMNLYPQPVQRRPSVQYIPVPYKGGEERPNKSML
ncbi:MAG: Serine dehydrogenase proteinase [Candidatus Methanoperedenaceae archaeon GB50]|nr:Serine dehydrogenase proteinase [Candidatus Methanoperedenaceae archaeon GB50]CAD7783423.1 MAG: Serine dehydrogenase proteinase [Candidatus Methanoperedenaceae archaeon GB50]